MKEVVKIARAWFDGRNLTDEDVCCLASCDRRELTEKEADLVTNAFYSIAETYGEEIDTYDPDYPRNTYYTGYRIGDHEYYTGYTGIAGAHWREEYDSIAMP